MITMPAEVSAVAGQVCYLWGGAQTLPPTVAFSLGATLLVAAERLSDVCYEQEGAAMRDAALDLLRAAEIAEAQDRELLKGKSDA